MPRPGGEEKIPRSTMVTTTSTGYNYFSDASTANNPNMMMNQQFQSFESNQEIYGLTSGMEMIGFPPKNNHIQEGGPISSSSKTSMNNPHEFYQQDFVKHPDFSTGISEDHSTTWHDDHNRVINNLDYPSLRSSQVLSLSLGNNSSNHPSTIGLQSFDLRQAAADDHIIRFAPSSSSSRDGGGGYFGKSMNIQHMMMIQEEGQFQIRSSKYLGPVQELLNEFCSLGGTTKQTESTTSSSSKLKQQKTTSNQWGQQDQENAKIQSLYSLDLLELQKRKAKLLQLLEEVDRRYKHYCNQMKTVVASFEAVAGNGAAIVYSTLASKAMSKHFRCLRDGIIGQIKATKKALGEKDTIAPGTTKGETPRLRLVDQTLRQQRAFQQMTALESHPWRPQRGLPERAVSVLRAWLFEHFLNPYPSDVDKHILAHQTGLSRSQVSNWFINARVRLWKPMVEEIYLEETKDPNLENMGSSDDNNGGRQQNLNLQTDHQDEKPTSDQLVRIDSECLSSIINHNPHGKNHDHIGNFGRVSDAFGAMELDFSSYDHNIGGGGGGSGNVSLTLGLQQHGGSGGGVNLAFNSSASQNSVFYAREHIEDCPPVQYSLLDSDQGQNLPYRNLMGAQLLHDLAG